MAGQHFPRDLGVPRLIGADQAERGQGKEEQEPAKTGKQDPVGAKMRSGLRASAFEF